MPNVCAIIMKRTYVRKEEGRYVDCFRIQKEKTLYEKLSILSDAAKYDVACTSSGTQRRGDGTGIGNCEKAGICHSFTPDGASPS